MKKITKLFFLTLIILLFSSPLFGIDKQSSQLIRTDHWVYDDITALSADAKSTFILETMPLSIGEIELFLRQIDYANLSQTGKITYDRIKNFINVEDDLVKAEEFRFYINLINNPELYYKSNKAIDWSFVYKYKDYFLTMPVIIGFSDYFTFQTDFYYGKNRYAASMPNSFTNLPIRLNEINFYFPDFSYFSGNMTFDKWGFTASLGRKGMKLGNTSMGSILYNDTFETDFYSQLNLYCKYLKYSMDLVQVDKSKFLYLHQLTFRPIKNLNLGIIEGSLLNAPFELRYLNPFNIMHNFGAWEQYVGDDKTYYGEAHFCAYFGVTAEYIPISNLRLYGIYVQNEMLDPGSEQTQSKLSVPSSIGGQVGIEYYFTLPNNSRLKTMAEVVYTSPYLYVKQSPDWSLYRNRNNEMHTAKDNKSWIGFPEGPDCFAIKTGVDYNSLNKWTAGFHYQLTMHGINTADNLFSQIDENNHYFYYPSVKYKNGNPEERNKAVADATNMWLHGIPEIKNEIIFDGSYKLLDNLDLTGQFIYTFVFNNKNNLGDFAQGVELALSLRYEIF